MEILSREQIDNDFEEEGYKKQEMFSIGNIKSRFVKPKSRAYNSKSALAEEIYNHWNKKLSYPMILKFIKNNGEQCVFELFNESKDKGIGLFIWLNNKNRTKFK